MNTETNISRADAIRHLIVCDSQFAWAGQTTLQLSEMLDLRDRGWIVEGDDNGEFDLTDAGRAVVEQALQSPAPAGMAAAAVEKLSAQIGQAIFGKPVTDLIELANRCNALQASTVKQSLTAAAAGLRAELLNRADSLEREAAGDRETGESIEQAIENGEGYTHDDPTDVAAGLQHGADRAEATAELLRKAVAALAAQPVFPLVELLDMRNQLHVMATTVVPNFCDLAAGLQGQVQGLIDAHRKLYPEELQ